jgi:hypothetical protein
MEVNSQRVSSTHAWKGRLSRLVWYLGATVLTLADYFLVGLAEVALVAAAGLGAGIFKLGPLAGDGQVRFLGSSMTC